MKPRQPWPGLHGHRYHKRIWGLWDEEQWERRSLPRPLQVANATTERPTCISFRTDSLGVGLQCSTQACLPLRHAACLCACGLPGRCMRPCQGTLSWEPALVYPKASGRGSHVRPPARVRLPDGGTLTCTLRQAGRPATAAQKKPPLLAGTSPAQGSHVPLTAPAGFQGGPGRCWHMCTPRHAGMCPMPTDAMP